MHEFWVRGSSRISDTTRGCERTGLSRFGGVIPPRFSWLLSSYLEKRGLAGHKDPIIEGHAIEVR